MIILEEFFVRCKLNASGTLCDQIILQCCSQINNNFERKKKQMYPKFRTTKCATQKQWQITCESLRSQSVPFLSSPTNEINLELMVCLNWYVRVIIIIYLKKKIKNKSKEMKMITCEVNVCVCDGSSSHYDAYQQ